jgi:polysaccharide biosynthesis/export protein
MRPDDRMKPPIKNTDGGCTMNLFAQFGTLRVRHSTVCGVVASLAAFGLGSAAALAQLHAGDSVAIIVYNHPDLSTRTAVDASGTISLPLVGTVDARDTEPKQLAERVRTRLSRYIPKVEVDVQIVSRNQSIFVSGGPGGVLPYTPGETLGAALAQLQSPQGNPLNTTSTTPATAATRDLLRGRVDLHRVTVRRDDRVLGPFDVSAPRNDAGSDPLLMPGDTIQLVDKPVRVEVRGEVREPGIVYLDRDQRLSDALLKVGGYVTSSATANIQLERGREQLLVSSGGADLSAPARDGDVLTVPRAPRIGVLGAVQHPGDVVLSGDTSLLSAVYNAGGPVKHADVSHVLLLRGGTYTTYDITAPSRGAAQNNPTLHDGDAVFVPEGRKIDWNVVWQAVGAVGRFLPYP